MTGIERVAVTEAHTRAPRTFVDVADVLDSAQHRRPYYPAADLADKIRTDLECLAASAIGRELPTAPRRDQAGDLIRIGWSIRKSLWYPGRTLAEGFASMWRARREPDWSLASCARTLALLVEHMDRHAAELPPLLDAMAAVCPENLPAEDVVGIALDVAAQWRAALAATESAAALLRLTEPPKDQA